MREKCTMDAYKPMKCWKFVTLVFEYFEVNPIHRLLNKFVTAIHNPARHITKRCRLFNQYFINLR